MMGFEDGERESGSLRGSTCLSMYLVAAVEFVLGRSFSERRDGLHAAVVTSCSVEVKTSPKRSRQLEACATARRLHKVAQKLKNYALQDTSTSKHNEKQERRDRQIHEDVVILVY